MSVRKWPILDAMIARTRFRHRPSLVIGILLVCGLSLACGIFSALVIDNWPDLSAFRRLAGIIASGLLLLTTVGLIVWFITANSITRKDKLHMKLHGHTIICGWNAHSLQLLGHLSPLSGQPKSAIVLINAANPAESANLAKQFPRLELHHVQGDFTEEVVLQAAQVEQAKTAIIVPDESWPGRQDGRGKDERTILAALAIKSINPGIKLSAMVLQAENEAHLRRARVDSVLINGEFSDFMLARSGNAPALPQAARSLLSPSNPTSLRQIPIPSDFTGKSFADLADFMQERNIGILVGVLSKASHSGLENILADDESDTDTFIRRKFQEAAIDLSAQPDQAGSVLINPGPDYQIGPHDAAFVVG